MILNILKGSFEHNLKTAQHAGANPAASTIDKATVTIQRTYCRIWLTVCLAPRDHVWGCSNWIGVMTLDITHVGALSMTGAIRFD